MKVTVGQMFHVQRKRNGPVDEHHPYSWWKGGKLMWKWEDLTPFGQGVVAGIVLGFLILMMIG